ncbi:unnamed protein product [Sphagnum troendelagicum]
MEPSFAAARLQAGLVGNYHPTVLQTTRRNATAEWRNANGHRSSHVYSRRIRHRFPSQFSGGKSCWILLSNTRTRNITPAIFAMSDRDGEIVSIQGSSFLERAALWSVGLVTEVSNLVQSLGFTSSSDKTMSSSLAGVQAPHITPKPTRSEHAPGVYSQASSTPGPKRFPSNFWRQSPIPSLRQRNEVRPIHSEKSLDISAARSVIPTPKRFPSRFQRQSPIPSWERRKKERTLASNYHQPEVYASAAFTPAPTRFPSRFHRQSPISGLGVKKRDRSFGNSKTNAVSNTEQASGSNVDLIIKSKPKVSLPDRLPSLFVRLSPIDSHLKRASTSSSVSQTATVVSEILHELASPATKKSATRKKSSSLKETQVVMEHIEAEITVQTESTHDSDLASYKLPELKSIAKARGLKGYSKLRKSELLELLQSSGNINQQ